MLVLSATYSQAIFGEAWLQKRLFVLLFLRWWWWFHYFERFSLQGDTLSHVHCGLMCAVSTRQEKEQGHGVHVPTLLGHHGLVICRLPPKPAPLPLTLSEWHLRDAE